jgi:hypothetical protein
MTILLVQMGNVFTAHMMKLFQYAMYRRGLYKARVDPQFATTQGELNKLHEGPEFRFAENSAQYMSTFFVCMTFNFGMPLLNWVAFVNFLLAYMVDKTYFINVVQSPARLTSQLSQSCRRLVPWAVALHLCVSIWTLSTTEIFTRSVSPGSRWSDVEVAKTGILAPLHAVLLKVSASAFHRSTYILILVLLGGVLLRLLFLAAVYVKKSGSCVYTGVFGQKTTGSKAAAEARKKAAAAAAASSGSGAEAGDGSAPSEAARVREHELEEKADNAAVGFIKSLLSHIDVRVAPKGSIARAVSYPRAVQRNLIKGLATYNVLHNPVYKELFAISWKFAMSHNRVRSIYQFKKSNGLIESSLSAFGTLQDREADSDARKVERMRRASALPALLHSQGQVANQNSQQKLRATATKVRAAHKVMDIFVEQVAAAAQQTAQQTALQERQAEK